MSLPQPPIGTVVTTDPVTGLPLTSTDTGIIDQIPLNSDPTALQDWGATGRPSQTLYPDSAPTVFSTVQAQHPNGIQAQSVQTDGNHAMLVKDVGGGGGGGAGQPTLHFNGGGTNITGNDTFVDHLFDYPLKVYGSCVTLVAEDKPTAFSSITFELYLRDNRTGSEKALHYITMSYDPATGGGNLCDTANIYWPNGLMFWDSTSTAAGDCNWGYRLRNLWSGTLTAVPLLWAGP